MKRRTSFGPDMGNSDWTPIDDEDLGYPLAIRPVVAQDLTLPTNDSNSYVDIGNGMYAPVRKNAGVLAEKDERIADERWQQFLAQQAENLPSDNIAYAVPDIKLIDKGYIDNASGLGGDYVYGNQKVRDGSIRGFHAGATANGHNRELRDENGNLTYGNWGGDAKAHAGMAEIQGTLAEGRHGKLGGTFNGPNARAMAGGNLKYVTNPDGTTAIDARLNGEVGAYLYDGSMEGSVNIPLTWLNNRWRALKKTIGEEKGERRELDLVLGGRASLGVGAGARAGAIIGEQGDGINGFRFYAGGGVGITPGADIKVGFRDRTGLQQSVEIPIRTPTSKYIAPYNKDISDSYMMGRRIKNL